MQAMRTMEPKWLTNSTLDHFNSAIYVLRKETKACWSDSFLMIIMIKTWIFLARACCIKTQHLISLDMIDCTVHTAQHINSKNECMLELMGPFEVETKHKFQMDVDFIEFCSFKPFHWNNWIVRTIRSTYINWAVLFPIRHNVAVLCCTMPCHAAR